MKAPNFCKSMKIKKGSEPIGTRHKVPTMVGNHIETPAYRVVCVEMIAQSNVPAHKDPMVTLAYGGGKSVFMFTPYLTVPLSILAKDFEPLTAADVFWENEKTDK